VLVSSAFLGWPFAIFKVASAAVTGVVGGYLTDAVRGTPKPDETDPATDGTEDPRRLRDGIDHALTILRTIWHWIVFGVVASALIEVFLPPDFFASLTGYGAAVPVLAALAVSLPLYVCSTASVPIAAALVAGGMPPGAALVFLMAGPATNVATVGAVYRGLGRRALVVYLGTIIAGSLAAAWAFDYLLTEASTSIGHVHDEQAWWAVTAAVLLLGLFAWFAADDLRRLVTRRAARHPDDQPRTEIGVSGMHCGGCVDKLERALLEEQGVTSVEVTLEPGRAVVRGSIDRERLRRVVEGLGFEVAEA
jgi:hypothetical protein